MIVIETSFWLIAAVLFYAHVGYPLVCAIAGWRAPRGKPIDQIDDTEWPPVTLIIPACNEEAILELKLENALAIDYPRERLEILVASDGSTDRTVEIATGYADRGIRLLPFEPRRGKASAISDAAEVATGKLICFCDANVMFHSDALKRLVAALFHARVGAASGDVRLASHESNFGEGESAFYLLERAIQCGESRLGSMMGVDGGMYVVRKELFERLAPDTILDDFVVTMRVIQRGFRVRYVPDAVADENGTPLARQEFRRRVRVSAGAVQSIKRGEFPPLRRPVEAWQYFSHKLLRWLGPALLAGLLITNALLWNRGLWFQLCLIAQCSVYGLALVSSGWTALRRNRLVGVAFYFVMSHVAMTVGLAKGLFNRQRVTWSRTERS